MSKRHEQHAHRAADGYGKRPSYVSLVSMDDRTYAAAYAASHAQPVTPEYVAGYAEMVILDAMLRDYRLLIVGAGTGGFVRLLRNYREIVCIDRTPEMIAAAIPARGVSFIHADFKDFDGSDFDAISIVGVVGSYMPWPGNEWALSKCAAMFKPGGTLIASHVPADTIFRRAKEIAFPHRTVVMSRHKFLRMMTRHGFSELVRVHRESSISIFRAVPHAAAYRSLITGTP